MTTTVPENLRTDPAPRPEAAGVASAVNKALMVLDCFYEAGPSIGLSELARRAGLAKSTTFRLLKCLEDGGYIEHYRDGTYGLAWRLFELGNDVSQCRRDGLVQLATPITGDLFRQTGLSVHLAVLRGTDVTVLDKVQGTDSVRVETTVGGRLPASATALGKALLAGGPLATVRDLLRDRLPQLTRYTVRTPGLLLRQLEECRDRGFVTSNEEFALGVCCTAAPIMDNGVLLGAISVSFPATHVKHPRLRGHADLVVRAAGRIAAARHG